MRGLYRKFEVLKDGKPAQGEFFVLRLDSPKEAEARAVKAAMITYAMFIASDNPLLAVDLRAKGHATGYTPSAEREAMRRENVALRDRIAELEALVERQTARSKGLEGVIKRMYMSLYRMCPLCEKSSFPFPECLNDGGECYEAMKIACEALEEQL